MVHDAGLVSHLWASACQASYRRPLMPVIDCPHSIHALASMVGLADLLNARALARRGWELLSEDEKSRLESRQREITFSPPLVKRSSRRELRPAEIEHCLRSERSLPAGLLRASTRRPALDARNCLDIFLQISKAQILAVLRLSCGLSSVLEFFWQHQPRMDFLRKQR